MEISEAIEISVIG